MAVPSLVALLLGLGAAAAAPVAPLEHGLAVDKAGRIVNKTSGEVFASWDELFEKDHTQEHHCGTHRAGDRHEDAPDDRRRLGPQPAGDCTECARHVELVSSALSASAHASAPHMRLCSRTPHARRSDFNHPKERYSPTGRPLYRIRVVVHVVSNGAVGALSDLCVAAGIDMLNDDFRGVGRAGTKTSLAGSVDTRIEFQLATTDAQGAPTTGILRHDNESWFNAPSGHDAVQLEMWASHKVRFPKERYLNIWTKVASSGEKVLLGCARAPSTCSPAQTLT